MEFTEQLYKEYKPTIQKIAYSFKRQRSFDYTDLVSVGLQAVWKATTTLDTNKLAPGIPEKHYLLLKARHAMVDFIRTESTKRIRNKDDYNDNSGIRVFSIDSDVVAIPDKQIAYDIEDVIINKLDKRTLLTTLRGNVLNAIEKVLTPRRRAILVSYYFDDIPTEDIAKRFNIAVKTVYATIHQSIKAIQKELNIDTANIIPRRIRRERKQDNCNSVHKKASCN